MKSLLFVPTFWRIGLVLLLLPILVLSSLSIAAAQEGAANTAPQQQVAAPENVAQNNAQPAAVQPVAVQPVAVQPGTGQPTPPSATSLFTRMLPMFIVVFLIFHFFVIRPQKNKVMEQQKVLSSLKRGEQVITGSGMVGRVSSVEKDFAVLEIAPNVKVRFELAAITRKLDKVAGE